MSLNLDKSTWKRVAFGDVIDSITDRVDNPSEAGVDRYVGLEHLDPGVMTVQRWDSPDKVEAQKLRFQPGDVIFGRRRAYQKKVAKAEFEGICSAHALVLRARPDYVDPEFLPVFLSSDYFLERAIEISVGSLSPTVNWRDLKVQEFEIPPLDEQERFADLLWAVEGDRRGLEGLIGATGLALSAALPSLLHGQSDSVPRALGDVAHVKHGFALPGDGFSDDPAYPTVVTPGNFAIGGGFQQATEKTFVGPCSEEYVLKAGDLIVSMTDLSKAGDTLGYSAIVPDDRIYLHNQRVGKVVIDADTLVLPEYLSWVLRTSDYRKYILRTAAGSTVRHTSPGRIEAYQLSLPSPKDQRVALGKVGAIEHALVATRAQLVAVVTLRASLMYDVFVGT